MEPLIVKSKPACLCLAVFIWEKDMPEISSRYVREYFWQTKIRKIITWIVQIGAAVLLAFLCAYFFGQRVVVTESSMEPTLSAGDKVLINTAVYKLSSPARGDIIAFRTGSDENQSYIIKRVIALPGETIQIKNGQIIINGETYIEEQNFPAINNPGIAENEITLEAGEYFVLGDNRNDSEDSRHLDIGLVDEDYIVGKLWLRYSPAGSFGFIE